TEDRHQRDNGARCIAPYRLEPAQLKIKTASQNPQSTRYFFAPNAIGIPQGQGYYQNTWVFLNNVNYGATENFSIGAGTVPVFLFGAEALPIWVLPKVSISTPRDNLHLAGGAVFGGVLGAGDSEGPASSTDPPRWAIGTTTSRWGSDTATRTADLRVGPRSMSVV
ncbi:hypothetical protein GGP55_003281, partial [Salinibacter ruber]